MSVGIVASAASESRRSGRRWWHRALLVVAMSLVLGAAMPGGQPPVAGSWPSFAGLWSWLSEQRAAFAGISLAGLPFAKPGGADGHAHYVGTPATAKGAGNPGKPARGARAADTARSPQVKPDHTTNWPRESFNEKTSKRIAAAATEKSDVYANTDGTFTRKVFQDPINYRAANGTWTPIDRSLTQAPGGRLGQRANSNDITFASLASDPYLVSARLDRGGIFGYGLVGAAPVAPELADNSALYTGVLPGVDLKLEVLASATKESLILRDASAPTTFDFELRAPGLRASLAENGSVLFTDPQGEVVASIPAAFMVDSKFDSASGDFTRSDAIAYQLIDDGGKTTLRMTLDPSWVGDRDRIFPITVDPTSKFYTTGDSYVYLTDTKDHSAENNLPIGTYDSGTHKARSLLHFDGFGATYAGNTISSASLYTHLTWTYDCTPRQFNVLPVNAYWSATTVQWPGPSTGAAIASATPSPGAACTNTSGDRSKGLWVQAQFTSLVALQGWISGATANYGLELAAPSETTSNQWKRFTSRNYANYSLQPYLSVTYAGNKPPQVDMMYPPYGYQSPTLTPTLVAGGHDPDYTPGKFTYDFTVKDNDDNSVVVDSGKITASAWTVPAGSLKWGKSYTWTVKTNDSLANSTTLDYVISTPVPQPRLTSTLTPNGGLGFAPASGNYTTTAKDAAVSTVGPPLTIERSYNSVDPRVGGAFGSGWSSVLDSAVVPVKDAANVITAAIVTTSNGQETAFGANSDGTFSSPQGRYATLRAVSDLAGTTETTNLATAVGYRMIDKDGTTFVFTKSLAGGRFGITKITDVHGATETFNYPSSTLDSVTSASGRTLHFTWATPAGATSPHIQTVFTDRADLADANSVSTWTYTYSGDLLTGVAAPLPVGKQLTYGYTPSGSPYSLYPTVVRELGPRAYLRLTDPAGSTTAADTIGAATGTVHGGVTFNVTGPLVGAAKAATFNGSSGYIEQQASPGLDAQQHSLSLWFKTTTAGGVLAAQSAKGLDSGASYPYTPNLFIGSDGKLRGQFGTLPGTGSLGNLLGAESQRCLDDKGQGTADGSIIELYSCVSQNNQVWTLDASGRITATIGTVTKCLDVTGLGTANGTFVQFWTCTAGTNQKWIMSPNGQIIGVGSDKCLNAVGTANLSRITIQDCTSPATPNQIWSAATHAPINTNTVVTDGNWHHVVLAAGLHSGASTQDQTIYLDGVATSKTGVTPASGQQFVQIGGGFSSAGWTGTAGPTNLGVPTYFNGQIAEVAEFQQTLTAADVAAMRTAKAGSVRLLNKVTAPSGSVTAQVGYDAVTSTVTSVTDSTGGTWSVGAPTVQGSYTVHSSAVLGNAPSDYWRLADSNDSDASNEVNGGTATYNSVDHNVDHGPFDDPGSADDDGFTYATSFDGATSYLKLPSNDVPTTSPVSVSLWFKVPNGNTEGGTLFGYQSSPLGQTSSWWTPAIFVGTDGKIHAKFWGFPDMTSTSTVNNGNWHHVVLAASTTSQSLYVDGAVDKTAAGTLATANSTYAYVGAGDAHGWPSASADIGGYFTGAIAEVSYYNAQLSAGQVSTMFGTWSKAKGAALARKYVVTDPTGGSRTTHTFEVTTGHKIAQTDSLGNQTTFGYNEDGYLYTTTNPLGNVTKNWYDPRGNIIQTETCQNTAAGDCSDTYFKYYPDTTTKVHVPVNGKYSPCNDSLIEQRAQGSSDDQDPTYLTVYSCDPVTGNRSVVTDALQRKTTTTFTDGTTVAAFDTGYAPAGLMSKQTAPNGALRTIVYYHNGDIATVTDGSGKVTTFTYDNLGRILTKTENTDTLGNQTTSLKYDLLSRPYEVTSPQVLNRVTSALHKAVTTTGYDDDGNVLTQSVADPSGGDPTRTVTYHYNQFGQRDWVKDAAGKTTLISYLMNTTGRLVTTTDPNGVVTAEQFDSENHELSQTVKNWIGDPNNPSTARDLVTVSKAYYADGKLASITNAKPGQVSNGVTTSYEYFDNGALYRNIVRDNDTSAVYIKEQNTYDDSGALVQQITNNGATTTAYAVDVVGRTTSSTLDPGSSPHLNRVTTTAYDDADSPVAMSELDRNGNVLSYTEAAFDYMGQPLAQTQYNTTSTTLSTAPPVTPTGRWKLNETSGTKAADSAANRAGTATNVTWANDATRGQVATFNGTSSEVAASAPMVDTTRPFSVALWAKMNSEVPQQYLVVMPGSIGSSAFKLSYLQNTDQWYVETSRRTADGGTQWVEAKSPAGLPQAGVWTHLVVTVDKDGIELYTDGVLRTTTSSTAPLNNASTSVAIGREYSQFYFGGSLSDFQVYQKSLTSSEVTAVGSGSLPAATSSVIRTTYSVGKGGLRTATTDPNGNTSTVVYDEAGRPAVTKSPFTSIEDVGGVAAQGQSTTQIGYDTFGERTEYKDANGNKTTTAYDLAGHIASVTQPTYTPPGTSTPLTPVTTMTYDAGGRQLTQTDPLGRTLTYAYDQLGRESSITSPGRTSGETALTRFVYDEVGNRTATIDAAGNISGQAYDYLNRVTKTWTHVGTQDFITSNTYGTSAYGDPGLLTKVTSPSGVQTQTAYNAAAEKISTTDPANHLTSYAYDDSGQLTKTTTTDGRHTDVTYDMAGRIMATKVYDMVNALRYTTSQTYDQAGNGLTSTDAMGFTTAFTYDSTGLLISEAQPVTSADCSIKPTPADCIVTGFGYDATDRRTRFTDGRGNAFITVYNTLGLAESVTEPGSATYTIAYDASGEVTTQTAPGGVTITHGYDYAGHLTSQSGSGAEVSTATRTFGYDIAGRMTSFSGATGTNTLTYDERNMLKTVTGGASGDASFGYDSDGRMTSRADAAGTTNYGYDSVTGLLNSVSNTTAGLSATLQYDSLNSLKYVTYGGTDMIRTFMYDNLHRLQSDEVKKGTTSLGSITYGFDFNGNEVSKVTTGFAGAASNSYGYDKANRLISWTTGSTTTNYTYDRSGNRTQAGGQQYTYDNRNRLLTSLTATYTYTARGTLQSVDDGTNTLVTGSDAFGQVLSQAVPGGPAQTYAYDALGRAIKPNHAYSGIDNDLAKDSAASYLRDPAGALFGELGSTNVYAWTDLHDDIVGQFTATSTALTASTAYDPIGKVKATTGGAVGDLGFQSEWTDTSTGRVNMLARWYNTDTGQFDSRDTVANDPVPASVNANGYAYANENPLTNTDPDGHRAIDIDENGKITYYTPKWTPPKPAQKTKPKNPKTLYHPCMVWASWGPPGCQPGTNKRMDNVSVCPHYQNTANYYANCTVYKEYADGTVCINGRCTPKSECGATDCRDVAQALDDMAGINEDGYGSTKDATAFTEEVHNDAVDRAAKIAADRKKAQEEAKRAADEAERKAKCSAGFWSRVSCAVGIDKALEWGKAHADALTKVANILSGVASVISVVCWLPACTALAVGLGTISALTYGLAGDTKAMAKQFLSTALGLIPGGIAKGVQLYGKVSKAEKALALIPNLATSAGGVARAVEDVPGAVNVAQQSVGWTSKIVNVSRSLKERIVGLFPSAAAKELSSGVMGLATAAGRAVQRFEVNGAPRNLVPYLVQNAPIAAAGYAIGIPVCGPLPTGCAS